MVSALLSSFKELCMHYFIIVRLLLLMINPTRCTNFSNLFWNETLHVSENSFVHQEFSTVHTAMVYVIQVCRQLSSRVKMSSILILLEICLQTWMKYIIAVSTVENFWWWTKELSEICRVSFQNKFEKLVHLVGFIIRIFRDARSHEPTIRMITYCIRICSVCFRNDWSRIWNRLM